ncbi:hypothetical protein AB0T83_11815 [Fluviibacterium sp. DFM31]|uniref:Phage late control D family protein n=1 Tax=Meridianimarinicoccus marinus TaxID=3231483 RepID=A0ABV3L7P4_9RHOB
MTTTADPIYQDRTFFAPAFQIALKGQNIGQEVIRDVLEVTFTDDLENIDSFEFALGDWDEVARLPKYSSPWDESGSPRKSADGRYDLPNFQPGAEVDLKMGYLGAGDLTPVMKGTVVSISTSFPAGGAPTCRIRVLNDLHKLQRVTVNGTYEGTRLGIAETLLRESGVTTERPQGLEEEDAKTETVNGTLYEEVFRRATEAGLSIALEEGDAGPVLRMTQPAQDSAVALLEWGRSLASFTPTLSTRGQVQKVVVRSSDITRTGDGRRVLAEATWADLDVAPEVLGPQSDSELEDALGDAVVYIDADETVRTEADARRLAIGRLKEIARELVTASAATVGAPELRAGQVVEIAGIGPRFGGLYRITKSTHTLGAAGYTTSFEARKEVLRG